MPPATGHARQLPRHHHLVAATLGQQLPVKRAQHQLKPGVVFAQVVQPARFCQLGHQLSRQAAGRGKRLRLGPHPSQVVSQTNGPARALIAASPQRLGHQAVCQHIAHGLLASGVPAKAVAPATRAGHHHRVGGAQRLHIHPLGRFAIPAQHLGRLGGGPEIIRLLGAFQVRGHRLRARQPAFERMQGHRHQLHARGRRGFNGLGPVIGGQLIQRIAPGHKGLGRTPLAVQVGRDVDVQRRVKQQRQIRPAQHGRLQHRLGHRIALGGHTHRGHLTQLAGFLRLGIQPGPGRVQLRLGVRPFGGGHFHHTGVAGAQLAQAVQPPEPLAQGADGGQL